MIIMRKPHISLYGGWWMVFEGGRNDKTPSCSGYFLDEVVGWAKYLWEKQVSRELAHSQKGAAAQQAAQQPDDGDGDSS